MWKFNPFKPKEPTGLEGRVIDIGNVKVQVCNVIAEGGFSCVYLARDVLHGSKQYALKHIICNDEESLELVMKEISVLKSLKGHPNVVTLHAHAMFDMGRTKEAILVMEYCEKSLVNVLESRGAAFFEEKKILTIFRDVCNAVFAMHCQSPPIAHRDLKAENLLLGPDELWKLCDFGSTSTNHKRFEKPEEMGIEEDNIRKHTTPAYRAPEMWDLFRREIINEKVDIWALGCLLFRISYFKSAFDGESKLQVLNGNYRIPDLPKYSTSITDLIRDMLQSSPDDRPDITQVWFRVNNLLPEGMQKSLPDRPPEMLQNPDVLEGTSKPSSKPMPRRSATPPNSGAESARQVSPASQNPRTGGSSGPLGAFWTTQHAQDSVVSEDLTTSSSLRLDSTRSDPGKERPNAPKKDSKPAYQGDAFNAFVAEFSNTKLSPESKMRKSEKEELLLAEIEKIKKQLAQANTEKAEMTSKYEKLSAICRSQRQELQELKQALNAKTPSPGRDAFETQASSDQRKTQASPSSQSSSTPQGREQGFDKRIPSAEPNLWQAFTDDSKLHTTSTNNDRKSVRTRNDQQTSQAAQENSGAGTWGFESDKFRAVPTSSPQISIHGGTLGNSQRFGESKKIESMPASQPAGWAGF